MTSHLYRVSVPVLADTPAGAKKAVTHALGFDEISINDLGGGGLEVTLVPDEKPYLVCRGCGEAFDAIIPAQEHGVFISGPDPSWCGEAGFDIVPESEAL